MNVAVVGAGIMGASACLALAKRGHAVTVFEQFRPGHDRGSSHGSSRIVRKAYPDRFYSEIMLEGYELWKELQEQSQREILHETGLLYFGDADSENMKEQARGLSELGIEHKIVEGTGNIEHVVRLERGRLGIFSLDGGWVHAENAVLASLELARSFGATVVTEKVAHLEQLKAFDRVVLTAGPWISELVTVPTQVTLQTLAYFQGTVVGPVWIEDGPNNIYGFPSEPGAQEFKLGVHCPDREVHPDEMLRNPSEEFIELMKDACRRLGLTTNPIVTRTVTCLYTNAPNEDFLVGTIDKRTIFASPCSGHGFKFGPWMGRFLADIVEGKSSPDRYPRWVYSAAG